MPGHKRVVNLLLPAVYSGCGITAVGSFNRRPALEHVQVPPGHNLPRIGLPHFFKQLGL